MDYAGAPRVHPKATLILILGILGLVACGPCAPIAWYMGNTALKEVNSDPALYEDTQLKVGRILGMVGTIIIVALLAIFLLLMVGAVLTS